ncbi:MAG: proline--tRNA ligase [Actinomycetota bacterium]|nr:proline--tRNA ligase [Actinomycetota bacterium]
MALPKQSEDFPGWYQEVVKQAELAETSLARGTMVIKPYGFAIWEAIQRAVDDRIKATGHQNLYFPLFIPYSLLEKEAEHVEGFAPEVAVVTHAGGEKLEEPLVVRPTSETIIWNTYAKWIQSYRDLPLLYNQWCNVVRWELRPRIFLRTTEFLWQEGHTAHETADEAIAEARMILEDVYADAVEKVLAVPVRRGRKTAAERFAGAVETMAIEGLMRDRKALQAGTSHYLGQNFAKAYGVQFQGRGGDLEFAYATSWGVSTRLVGGAIMTHGDDKGLRLPPALAPYQVVIVPIYKNDDEKGSVVAKARAIKDSLTGVRVRIDDRDEHRPGYKFNEWELKGVPLRIELGPRDIAADQVMIARRDTGEKQTLPTGEVPARVPRLLEDIQVSLFAQASAFRDEYSFDAKDYGELAALIADPGGFVTGGWCGNPECEAKVKADTKATIRYLPLDPEPPAGECIVCGTAAVERATWAQAY